MAKQQLINRAKYKDMRVVSRMEQYRQRKNPIRDRWILTC